MSQVVTRHQTDGSWASRRVAGVAIGVVIAVVVVAAVAVATAPANWLAGYLAERTQGRVLLADARGTIWSGNAVLALAPPVVDSNKPAIDASEESDRLALPGRVIWTLEVVRTLAPVLHLTHDGVLLQPVDIRYANGDLSIDAGAAVLPTSMLRLAGTPLNTLQPEGRSELRWGATHIDTQGALIGEGSVRIADLSLAVSPVKPLGNYRVTWSSNASGLTWKIATERGPLELQGSGSTAGSASGRRVQMRVTARPASDASPAVVAQLKTLLDTMGTHGGSEAVIEIGGRT